MIHTYYGTLVLVTAAVPGNITEKKGKKEPKKKRANISFHLVRTHAVAENATSRPDIFQMNYSRPEPWFRCLVCLASQMLL